MTDIPKEQVRELLRNDTFRNSVLDAMASSADTEDDLIEDIADELSDIIEDDPSFKKELIARMFKDKDTKQRILDKLVEELQ